MSHGFSKAKILQHEPLIYDYVHQLVERMKPYAQSRKEFPLLAGFRCMTLDLISEFLFGVTSKALESEKLHDPILDTFDGTFITIVSYIFTVSLGLC